MKALCDAAAAGQIQQVRELVEVGTHLNKRCGWLGTPLCVAATHNQLDCVRWLLAAGADAEIVAHDCDTPLMRAARKGYLGCVGALLQAGASFDPTTGTACCPPIAEAASFGHLAVVKLLLQAGAPPHEHAPAIKSPLWGAVLAGQDACLVVLLSAGAPVNGSGGDDAPLVLAALEGYVSTTRLLAGEGATPLNPVVESQRKRVSQLLAERGHHATAEVLQNESRWRRRRPLALVREQRVAVRDPELAKVVFGE